MKQQAIDYSWDKELEKTIIHSLVTTFGLDFLLFEDKKGGDVNTIHNVRQGIYATDDEKKRYEERGDYHEFSSDYHSHSNYKETGKTDKELQQSGNLHDAYRNKKMNQNEQRNLDHVISAKEIHDDAGRVLAELNGIELANKDSNLQTTSETINKSKKQTSIQDYTEKLPSLIDNHKKDLLAKEKRLSNMPRNTPEQKQKAAELEAEISKTKKKIEELQSIDIEAMKKRDKEARAEYEKEINIKYYTSSKFLKQTGHAAAVSGLKMGTRQMLGLIMAEVWFELREQIPNIIKKMRSNFDFSEFINQISETLKGIYHRIQARFQDFLVEFKNGTFSGIISSITTTIFNIFSTTKKTAVKIIREVWGQLIQAFKLIFFNPEQLDFVDLCKGVVGILSTAAGAVIGSMTHAHLLPLCSFPFGSELAAFAGALVTGIVTLGLTYTMLYSNIAHKIWEFIESLMPHAGTLKKYQEINAELDRYLSELTRIEFNMDPEELSVFSNELAKCNNEIQRGLVLKDEIARRGIELPYEMGNTQSTRNWLASLVKK